MQFDPRMFQQFEDKEDHEDVHRDSQSFVTWRIGDLGPTFTINEVTVDGEVESRTHRERTVYRADCGHQVGFRHPAELAGQCSKTGEWCCYRCLAVCERCHCAIGPRKQRHFGLNTYCPWCRFVTVIQAGTAAIAKGLHNGLSRDLE